MTTGNETPRLPLELSQEESAWILHALMAEKQFRDFVLRMDAPLEESADYPLARMYRLYSRISDLNSELRKRSAADGE